MIIKLTRQEDNKSLFVNTDKITFFTEEKVGTTVHFEQVALLVKETPGQIKEKMSGRIS